MVATRRAFSTNGRPPESVSPFGAKALDGFPILGFGQSAIAGDACVGIGDVCRREEGAREPGRFTAPLRFVRGKEIKSQSRGWRRTSPRSAGKSLHSKPEKLAVKIEADRDDVAALGRPQKVARAADFEVAHRHFESRTEIRVLFDRGDAFARGAHQVARKHQVGVSLCLGASHTSAKLVEIGEAKEVGPVNNHRVGIGNIQAAFDDRGRDKHINITRHEGPSPVQFVFAHLTMPATRADGHSCPRRLATRSMV